MEEFMITLLVPTMNRSDFLIRMLRYYDDIGFEGCICIGDSSNDQHIEKTKHAIKILKNKIRIIYRNFPKPPYIHNGMVIKALIEIAPTPYAVFAGDDDFLIPNGLEKCIAFLDVHPEYSAAHGIRVAVRLKSSGAFGELKSANFAPQPILEHETAAERWAGYLRNAVTTQYSVHRTETWRRMYRDVASIAIHYFGPEILPCSMSSILGKIKGLDCLSIVIQQSENRIFDWNKQSMYQLINQLDWFTSLRTLRNCIIDALVQKDDISNKKAQEIVDRELWHHILSFLQWQYHKKYNEFGSRDRIKDILRRVPGLIALNRAIRKPPSENDLERKYKNRISLDFLLNPSSPFYADFIQVYHVIVDSSRLSSQIK